MSFGIEIGFISQNQAVSIIGLDIFEILNIGMVSLLVIKVSGNPSKTIDTMKFIPKVVCILSSTISICGRCLRILFMDLTRLARTNLQISIGNESSMNVFSAGNRLETRYCRTISIIL